MRLQVLVEFVMMVPGIGSLGCVVGLLVVRMGMVRYEMLFLMGIGVLEVGVVMGNSLQDIQKRQDRTKSQPARTPSPSSRCIHNENLTGTSHFVQSFRMPE